MTTAVPYSTSRLRFRQLRLDDLPNFHAYRKNEAVARYQGWSPMSLAEAEKFLQEQAAFEVYSPDIWSQLAIADLASDRLVGDFGVCVADDAQQAEFGLTLTPHCQNKGLGTEAIKGIIAFVFEMTPVSSIIACADTRNLPCLRALTRAGMVQIESREAEYKGEKCIEQIFQIVRECQ